MRKLTVSSVLLLLSITCLAQAQTEKEAIKKAIIQSYARPLYQGGSIEDMRLHLHEGFEMFVLYKGEFSKRSKTEWLQKLEEVRSRPKKKPMLQK